MCVLCQCLCTVFYYIFSTKKKRHRLANGRVCPLVPSPALGERWEREKTVVLLHPRRCDLPSTEQKKKQEGKYTNQLQLTRAHTHRPSHPFSQSNKPTGAPENRFAVTKVPANESATTSRQARSKRRSSWSATGLAGSRVEGDTFTATLSLLGLTCTPVLTPPPNGRQRVKLAIAPWLARATTRWTSNNGSTAASAAAAGQRSQKRSCGLGPRSRSGG